MNRRFSLRSGSDFQRVWHDGKSWSNSLIVVRALANDKGTCRFGFVAGKKVGKATLRNRVKRLMREAIRHRLLNIVPGWDIIMIARGGAERVAYNELDAAIAEIMQRAQLIVSSAVVKTID